MRCNFEIDFLRKQTSIERKQNRISVERFNRSIDINRLINLITAERKVKSIYIDRFKYRVIRVNIPYFTDWVILQNDYLPIKGEYFLN